MQEVTIRELKVVDVDGGSQVEYRAVYNYGTYREVTFVLYPGNPSGMVWESLLTDEEFVYRGAVAVGYIVPVTW